MRGWGRGRFMTAVSGPPRRKAWAPSGVGPFCGDAELPSSHSTRNPLQSALLLKERGGQGSDWNAALILNVTTKAKLVLLQDNPSRTPLSHGVGVLEPLLGQKGASGPRPPHPPQGVRPLSVLQTFPSHMQVPPRGRTGLF